MELSVKAGMKLILKRKPDFIDKQMGKVDENVIIVQKDEVKDVTVNEKDG